MSAKNYDFQGRHRKKMIAFRVSEEENEVLISKVRMSGLSKQDYLIHSILNQEYIVQGNPYVYRELRNYLEVFIQRFKEINTIEDLSFDELDVLERMLQIITSMKYKKMTQINTEKETPTK